MDMVKRKITMCSYAYFKGNAVLPFLKELWPLECPILFTHGKK
jgi:hypothetical protein